MRYTVMVVLAAACFGGMVLPATAQEDAPEPPAKEKKVKQKKPKPAMAEVSVTGTIAKQEKKGKNDKVTVKYVLTDGEGNKSRLPKPKKGKGEDGAAAKAINLDDYLDVGVTVTGQGMTMERKGKKVVRFKNITSVTKGGGVADIEVFPKDGE